MNRKQRRTAAKLSRNQERVKTYGEVFTPTGLVRDVLSKLPTDVFADPTKTFIDPACGNGQFLDEVIRTKVKNGSTVLKALDTTYGIEIQPRWVQVCRQRLFDVAIELGLERKDYQQAIQSIVMNILCGDALEMMTDDGLDVSKAKLFVLPFLSGVVNGKSSWQWMQEDPAIMEAIERDAETLSIMREAA